MVIPLHLHLFLGNDAASAAPGPNRDAASSSSSSAPFKDQNEMILSLVNMGFARPLVLDAIFELQSSSGKGPNVCDVVNRLLSEAPLSPRAPAPAPAPVPVLSPRRVSFAQPSPASVSSQSLGAAAADVDVPVPQAAPLPAPSGSSTSSTSSNSQVLIPCEVCHNSFPFESFNEHLRTHRPPLSVAPR